MNPSLFIEYIDKYFRLVIGKITEKINGKKTEEQLLHKTMLTEEYSADLTWGSTELNTSVVAADVVAMDSSLPLKKRDKISNASGVIPKIGIKFSKGEKAISDINVMRARGADETTVVGKIFDDAPKAIKGVDVRKEIMFQEALSTGVLSSPTMKTSVRASGQISVTRPKTHSTQPKPNGARPTQFRRTTCSSFSQGTGRRELYHPRYAVEKVFQPVP